MITVDRVMNDDANSCDNCNKRPPRMTYIQTDKLKEEANQSGGTSGLFLCSVCLNTLRRILNEVM